MEERVRRKTIDILSDHSDRIYLEVIIPIDSFQHFEAALQYRKNNYWKRDAELVFDKEASNR